MLHLKVIVWQIVCRNREFKDVNTFMDELKKVLK